MGLFRKMEFRHLAMSRGEKKRTTIAMEPDFWKAADLVAEDQGTNWRDWARSVLANKPEGWGRASWLRVAILKGAAR